MTVSGIVRFRTREQALPGIGMLDGDFIRHLGVDSAAKLLRLSLAELQDRCAAEAAEIPIADVHLLPPVDGRIEVWAAGVTYKASQRERMRESHTSDIYERVYSADRPELFFKSTSWRVVGDGEDVAVRSDSEIDVPEPELALVLNNRAETVGYLICNDVSSRSIEGENPLYLPQAKVFLGGCALSSVIRPAWHIRDPYDLGIRLSIERDGVVAWAGAARTADLHRSFEELVEHLFRADIFPDGVILSTGTSLVPELPFSLAQGDMVTIEIDQVGTLRNPVVRGLPAKHAAFASATTPEVAVG